ncbi:MAG TPA: DsbA family protein, partial [Novosphingobium sp.]
MTQASSRLSSFLIALGAALAGGAGGWYWQAHRLAADPAGHLAAADRAAIEQVVHDYLLAHPEVLPKAMDALEQRQTADRLGALRAQLEQPAPGAVLGNPQGKVTLVEFTDYACGYCRKSVADVDALIAANPDLKVVVRELPILTPESADAAKMALAAAEQGKYAAFHKAMFTSGRPSAETIAAAAAAAGLDLARARTVIARPETEAELVRNLDLAKALGFTGTPSWVVGDALLTGAVGPDQLSRAV